MPKQIPVCPSEPSCRKSSKECREYQIELVTPLFGGGVEAGEADSTFPVRGTSVRGQLQFWWRATRGAICTTREELFARSKEVWGTTGRASPVEIEVIWQGIPATSNLCAEYKWDQSKSKGKGGWRLNWDASLCGSALPYALFPFQGKEPKGNQHQPDPEKAPAHFIKSGQFTTRLRFPESLQQDVETAVWAWVNFGGIGARTRRGCGSLYCAELAPPTAAGADLKTWFQQSAGTGDQLIREWPTLPSRFLCVPKPIDSMAAWNQVIDLLKQFRQGVGVGRNPGSQNNRPGRSRWPEPETIREATNKRANKHQRLTHVPDDAFPRAEFGLPMVFHFQGQGEPPDTVLYPASGNVGEPRERMSSPLILKPLTLACGKAIPFVMRLVTPSLTAVELRIQEKLINQLPGDVAKAVRGTMQATDKEGGVPLPKPTFIRDVKLQSYEKSPLAGSMGGSALVAFQSYANDNGFTEVVR